jgi:hypothetical protein
MKKLTKLFKKFYLPLIVICIAFLSYNYNFFRVANHQWFLNYSMGSEYLVTAGLINGKDKYGRLFLGRYTNDNDIHSKQSLEPVFEINQKNLIELDEIKKNLSGKFKKYDSQYGLQLHFFYYLQKLGIENIKVFQGITAMLMSIVVGILFYLLRKNFSTTVALLFSASLVLSPYVVVFARNLYWVEATWFLPMIVSMYYGKIKFLSWPSNLKFFIFFVVAYLIKMLCGYEYLTTIAIASCVPIILYMSLDKKGLKETIIKLSINATSTLIAFILASSIHVNLLSKDSSKALDHIDHIVTNAKVRTQTHNPSEIKELCKYKQNTNRQNIDLELLKNCEETYKKSSTKVGKIILRYLIFDNFLPWLGNFSNIKSSNFTETKDYDILKSLWEKPSKKTLRAVIYETETQTKKNLVIIFLNTFLFLLLILTAFFRASFKMRLVLMFSLSAPLSWFIIAQGHSALHFGLNYVLWCLPLVPFCLIAILSNNNKVI